MGSREIRSNPSRVVVGGAVLLGLRAADMEATSLEAEFIMVMVRMFDVLLSIPDCRFVVDVEERENLIHLF
jgi:hypothetical protein